jgi:putative transposase
MPNPEPLKHGCYYHIFNRGTNGESLFHQRRDYLHFLDRYIYDIVPVAETYAYCLVKNHFHLAIRTLTSEEQTAYHAAQEKVDPRHTPPFSLRPPSRQFSNLFTAYARWFNIRYERTGSLLEHPFHRILVDSDVYLKRLINYIHHNPQHHGFVDDYRDWPFSSYSAVLSTGFTRVSRDAILVAYGGREAFVNSHAQDDGKSLSPWLTLE